MVLPPPPKCAKPIIASRETNNNNHIVLPDSFGSVVILVNNIYTKLDYKLFYWAGKFIRGNTVFPVMC